MTAAPSIRDAAPGDLATLLGLIRALAEYEREAKSCVIEEPDLRQALFCQQPPARAVLAERDGATVGFALWYYTFSTFAGRPDLFLEDIFVVPHARRGGVGRALFRHLARQAIARNCRLMEWRVLDWNAPAIDFYRRIGATPMQGWHVQQLGRDALAALAA